MALVVEDATLLARAAAGDDRAFAAIYEAHRRPMFRLAYGILLDADEARDAVQEAFLRLHRAAPSWEPRAAVRTWLHRVVLNHCLSLRQRLVRMIFAPPPERETRDSPETKALAREAVVAVERSLETLPMKQRAVVCLHLEEELDPSEIAPLVGMTPNATRVTLHRALTKLRSDLSIEEKPS